MCMITTALTAGALTAVGATTAAASTATVAATTVAANMIVGAGVSAGIGAATGARGRSLALSAGIGAAAGGAFSGVGMAAGGVTTLESAGAGAAPDVFSTSPGLFAAKDAAPTLSTTMNGERFVLAGSGADAHWVPASEAAAQGGAQGAAAAAAGGGAERGAGQLASAALQLGGAGAEAYGSYRQGVEESRQLRAQAKLDEVRAGQALEAAAVEKADLARKSRQLVGKGRTAAAANGVMLEARAESAPAVWEQDAAAELAWEGAKVDYNANLEAWGYMENARQKRIAARNARRLGNLKSATSLVRGGAGAFASVYGAMA